MLYTIRLYHTNQWSVTYKSMVSNLMVELRRKNPYEFGDN